MGSDMFLKRLIEIQQTLLFRLTLWYAFSFILSSLLAFLVFYFSAFSYVYGRADTEILSEINEFSTLFTQGGLEEVKQEILLENETENTENVFIRLISRTGSELIATDTSSWNDLTPDSGFLQAVSQEEDVLLQTRSMGNKPYEVRVAYKSLEPNVILQIGFLLTSETLLMNAFEKIFGVTMIVVFLLSGSLGWWMARRALRGIEEVTETARQISGGRFSQRVPLKNRGTEIERLAKVFNHMLDQIQKLIQELKEITDNIAHDLKSPITRIRGEAEVILMKKRSIPEYEGMAASTIEECDGLLEMINSMLDISEAEMGIQIMDFREIDLAGLVRDVCDLFEPFAEKEGLKLILQSPESVRLDGDTNKLQRLIVNLLDNAVKYTPRNGRITLTVSERTDGIISMSVSDTGIGIAENHLPRIFDRFYRCDPSRSRTSGNGLGLCLARAIARSHGGEIRVRSEKGKGSNFEITLPQAPFQA